MKAFIIQQFDKLLLTGLLLLFTAVMLHVIHNAGDAKALDWAANAFSALLGALLGLITGARLASRAADAPKDEEQPK